MKDNSIIETLIEIGLEENEAIVYSSLLSLGQTTVLKIAKVSGIKRTTIYSVIEQLKRIGLVRVEVVGFKNKIVAEPPEKLEGVFEFKRQKLVRTLPKLQSLYKKKETESVLKYYEGLNAIKNIYEGLLEDVLPHEDYWVLSNMQAWSNLDEHYFLKFIERRAKLPINTRMLLTDSEIARKTKKFAQNYNSEVKILPPETTLETNSIIIPRRLVIHQLVPPVTAVVIENPSIIKMHREMYNLLWNSIRS